MTSQMLCRISMVICAFCYAGSFFLPVTDAGSRQEMVGYEAFYMAPLSLVYLPTWLANPAAWMGAYWLEKQDWRRVAWTGCIAVLLALSEVWLWDDPAEVGYYLWLGSMVILAATGIVGLVLHSKPTPSEQVSS